ncbi:MAG: hypothetical protein EOM50_03285 [Erysipelotrichia bacterium]|nr:hypothetical protein [Erysipelotrichia bacterium]NCC55526.1 hypothetical protein [Erysipelotrichia bacterium]
MFRYTLRCPHCKKPIDLQAYRLKTKITCPHCQTHYLLIKHIVMRILEVFLLFIVAGSILSFMPNNNVIIFLCFVFVFYVGNIFFDLLMLKIVKWRGYYTLVERTMPLDKQKNE